MSEPQQVTLRNFDAGDCDFLAAHFKKGKAAEEALVPGLSATERALALVAEWAQKRYKGAYFEQFAICVDARPVGWISLYAPYGDFSIGVGFEIIERERRKGYCCQALRLVLEYAKTLGYKTATSQVRKNNTPSIRLHEKCGFAVTGEGVSGRGNACYFYQKDL